MCAYIESLFSLQGKIALITGGTRGIGQSLALALCKAGADVVLVQRDGSKLETAAKVREIGRKAWIITCDLSSNDQVSSVVRKVTGCDKDGGLALNIDILVNCGGIQRRHHTETYPDEVWQEVLQVNLNTAWTLSRDVGRHMLERRCAQEGTEIGRGKIINVASLRSFQGGFMSPAYSAAKHGILGMTKALSNDWSEKGINVNCIAPGYFVTDMNAAMIADPIRSRQVLGRIPAGRFGKTEDLEGAIVFLASRASDYMCGETITIDGGWMAG